MMEKITTMILKPPIEKMSLTKKVHDLIIDVFGGGVKWITPNCGRSK